MSASVEGKKPKHSEQPKKRPAEDAESRDRENDEKQASEEEAVHAEEEKADPQARGQGQNKNTSSKIFHNFDSIRDLRDFLVKFVLPGIKRLFAQPGAEELRHPVRDPQGEERLGPDLPQVQGLLLERTRGRFVPRVKRAQKGTFLLAGKKRSQNRTSNYLISLSPDDFKKNSPNVLGKVRYPRLLRSLTAAAAGPISWAPSSTSTTPAATPRRRSASRACVASSGQSPTRPTSSAPRARAR